VIAPGIARAAATAHGQYIQLAVASAITSGSFVIVYLTAY
jgi:hypothetical protein